MAWSRVKNACFLSTISIVGFCGTICEYMSHCRRQRKANFLRQFCVWFVVLTLPFYGVVMAALWGQLIFQPVKAGSFVFPDNPVSSPSLSEARIAGINIPFIENHGQYDPQVKYAASLISGSFFLTQDNLTYALSSQNKTLALKETFLNNNGQTLSFDLKSEDTAPTRTSFFKGNDPKQWQSDVSTFNTVSLGAIYSDIEIKLKAKGKTVEKFFYLAPEADPSLINAKLEGSIALKVANDGSLVVDTVLGEVRQTRPIAYQDTKSGRKNIDVAYVLKNNNTYGFVAGDYDRQLPLVIDPSLNSLIASTFAGGTGNDRVYAMALDASGNVYTTGYTASSGYPTTAGVYDTGSNGGDDVLVSVFNSTLTQLSASTFLGGSGTDRAWAIKLDTSNNVYITGQTASSNFPTVGAYDSSANGGTEVFISKLTSNLTTLSASTYLGGAATDIGYAIGLDSTTSVYVAGYTDSTDFPVSVGAYDTAFGGVDDESDAFIFKLTTDLSTRSAGTYLGGNAALEYIYGLTIDGTDNIYVTGYTDSTNFPTTAGVHDTSHNGGDDVFVSKLNSGLTTLSASTFFGGTGSETARAITLDGSGNIYITGHTSSDETTEAFPVTAGAYDRTHNGGVDDVFVAKFASAFTLTAATYLGGSVREYAYAMGLDSSGNINITGTTFSSGFPTVTGSYDTSHNGSTDTFVAQFASGLDTLPGSTFLSGTIAGPSKDSAQALAVASSGDVYVGGFGTSNFPTTAGAYDTSYNLGTYDVFIAIVRSPTVQFSATSSSGSETTASVNFGLTLSLVSTVDALVDYALTGTATGGGSDYTLADGTATISAGSTSTNITATIVNDDRDENDETMILTLSNPRSVSLGSNTAHTYTITDNDTAGVTVTESSGSTAVTEGGATDSYTVVFTSQPTANVTITPSPNAQVSVSPTTLTFTSANWNSAQTVIVTAVDDGSIEGNHTGAITHAATSSDTTYNGISIASVTPSITDNDRASGGNSLSNPIQNQFPPVGVSDLIGQALSTTSVKWCFIDNANNENGFVLHNQSESELGSAPLAAGIGSQICITEGGLTPNTQITNRHVHAFNAMGNIASETAAAVWTLVELPPVKILKGASKLILHLIIKVF